MQETNGNVLTTQEYEEVVMDVTLGMDDCYSLEEVDHGAYEEVLSNESLETVETVGTLGTLGTLGTVENLVNDMEDVAKGLKGTNEQAEEAVNKGKDLGELIGEILSKYPNAVKKFNEKETMEERFEYARMVIENLWMRGKHFVETNFLTDEFMKLDELEKSGETKALTFIQTVKKIAVKVIAMVVGLVVETVFFTLDTALETVACLTRIAGHVVVEVFHSGKQIRDSFKRHYLK